MKGEEVLTLQQTRKLPKRLPVVVFGRQFWDRVIDFDVLVEQGMIDSEDLDLFCFADTPQEALDYLKAEMTWK